MQERPKYIDVVVKLNRLTKEGKLRWQEDEFPLLSLYNKRYRAQYKDKYFVISGPPNRELLRSSITNSFIPDANQNIELPGFIADNLTQKELMLHLIKSASSSTLTIEDDEGNTLFIFPQTSLIQDLMSTVESNSTIEAESFLNDFLQEEM